MYARNNQLGELIREIAVDVARAHALVVSVLNVPDCSSVVLFYVRLYYRIHAVSLAHAYVCVCVREFAVNAGLISLRPTGTMLRSNARSSFRPASAHAHGFGD